MTVSEAIWSAAKQHVFLFSGFIILSAVFALAQLFRGKPEARWMALMTGVWVLINAGVAVWLGGHIHQPSSLILTHVFSHIRCYMWMNIGADIVYALVGAFLLLHRGRHQTMLRGFGKSVLIQAAGLFTLDTIFLTRVIALHQEYLGG